MKILLIAFACLSLLMAGVLAPFVSYAAQDKFEGESSVSWQRGKRARARTGKPQKRTAVSQSSCQSGRNNTSRPDSGLNGNAIKSQIAKAKANGSLGVIIGLCVKFVPEGELGSQQAVQSQRQAIALAQDNLLRSLSAYKITSVKKYEFVPYIAMRVDAAALSFLKTSSKVASIEEDVESLPLN